MHRWQFQKIIRPLLPLLVLLLLLCVVIGRQKALGVSRAFAGDDAYRHLTYARVLAQTGTYGLIANETRPATYDVVWRLILGFSNWIRLDPMASAYLFSALCGVFTVLMVLRIARLLFPFPPFIIFAAVLFVISPGFIGALLSGTCLPLAMCLITAATLFHIEGLLGRRRVLPMSSATMIGLAMWLRTEFMLVWVVFALHAWLLSLLRNKGYSAPAPVGDDDQDNCATLVFLRGIAGFLMLALFLLPMVTWNSIWIKVPWPRMMGAPLAMDIWARVSIAEAFRRSTEITMQALPALYGMMLHIPALGWGIERVFFWFGILVLVALSVWRHEERPFTVVLAIPLLLPLLYALIYPYTGKASVTILFHTFAPQAVLMMAFGIFRLPILVEGVYRKYKEGLPAAYGFRIWWCVTGSILMLICFAHFWVYTTRQNVALLAMSEKRAALKQALDAHDPTGRSLATDAPGWLTYTYDLNTILDFSDEAAPDVLACLGPKGGLDPYKFKQLIDQVQPDYLLRWTKETAYVESLVKGMVVYPVPAPREEADALPTLVEITYFGVL
ncbi:MAG: hypothetical protein EOM20_12375 [Spartobacteria bacterium]|nr:hypothetical protein [Spartobacteria bacterium]